MIYFFILHAAVSDSGVVVSGTSECVVGTDTNVSVPREYGELSVEGVSYVITLSPVGLQIP